MFRSKVQLSVVLKGAFDAILFFMPAIDFYADTMYFLSDATDFY